MYTDTYTYTYTGGCAPIPTFSRLCDSVPRRSTLEVAPPCAALLSAAKPSALDNDLACNRGYLAKSMRSGGLVDPLAAEERSNLFLDSTGLDSLPGVEGL